MFSNVGLLSLLAAATILVAQADVLSPPSSNENLIGRHGVGSDSIPGSFIVQFADQATDVVAGALGAVTGQGNGFLDTVQGLLDLDIGFTVGVHLDYELFQGISVRFPDQRSAAEGVSKLKSLDIVKGVWPNRINRPSAPLVAPGLRDDDALRGVGASHPSELIRSLGSPLSQTDDSLGPSGVDSPPSQSAGDFGGREDNVTYVPLQLTQVDKLHEKGIFGNGVKVCIVDSGIDYTHPALGGAFGKGHLVAFGRDLVGDNYKDYDTDTPMPDDDPRDICVGHGTACAGVIAAQPGNIYGLVGVAPNVTLGAYRVSDCNGNAENAVLLQGLNEAYEDGCQIISISMGAPTGDDNDPLTVLGRSIVEKGVSLIASAGNSGSQGLFHVESPGIAKGATCVGSLGNEVRPDRGYIGNYTVDESDQQPFLWLPDKPSAWANVELPLIAPRLGGNGSGDATDDCTLSADTPDLSGYISLLSIGDCDKDGLARQVASHSAKHVIFYDPTWVYRLYNSTLDNVTGILASAVVHDTTAEAWLKALESGSKITVQMADPDTLSFVLTYERWSPDRGGGQVSRFNAWGLTRDLNVKPSFIAPGANVLTTSPVWMGSWSIEVGTSFAAPFVAGVAALIAQARGTLDPATIQTVLSATAHAHPFYNWTALTPYIAPPIQQGTGLIQAFDAAYTTTLLSRSTIAFNDTDHFIPNANFTINNLDTKAVTFQLGHTPASTIYTFAAPGAQDPHQQQFPGVELVQSFATIDFDCGSQITVPAGGEAQVSLTLTPPTGFETVRFPIYSGWITLNGTNGENLSLIYSGAASSAKAVRVIADAYLYNSNDTNQLRLNNTPTPSYLVPYNETDYLDNVTYPAFFIDLILGSLVADAQLISWDGTKNGTQEIPAGTSLGSIWRFPQEDYPPTDYNIGPPFSYYHDGRLQDGSVAPEGNYILEISALKRFGDRNKKTDYEFRRTPVFNMKYIY